MPNWYERKDQRLYICNEESYGKPRGESAAWTKISATSVYPQRLNIIPEGVDVPLPKIEKLKKYDISAFKYPSHVVSGNRDPVTFTIEMELQRPVFLAYAIGSCVSVVHTEKETASDGVTTISTATFTSATATFVTNSVAAGDILHIKSGSSSGDRGFYEIASVDGETQLTLKNANFAGDTVCVYEVYDYFTHTVTEELGTTAKSFTLHCELPNSDNDNMIYDLFGCVVEEYKLAIVKGNSTVKETVTISSPACDLTANKLTKPPKPILFDKIYVFANLTEVTSGEDWRLLQEGVTSRRPDAVESVNLTIKNNYSFKGDLGYRHMIYAIPTKRNVTLEIGGYISSAELLDYWEGTWDEANDYPTGASGHLNSVIYLNKGTNRTIKIAMANLMVDAFSTNFITIDEGIKRADITLTEAPTPAESSGKMFYELADAEDGIIIVDEFPEEMYHHATS